MYAENITIIFLHTMKKRNESFYKRKVLEIASKFKETFSGNSYDIMLMYKLETIYKRFIDINSDISSYNIEFSNSIFNINLLRETHQSNTNISRYLLKRHIRMKNALPESIDSIDNIINIAYMYEFFDNSGESEYLEVFLIYILDDHIANYIDHISDSQ